MARPRLTEKQSLIGQTFGQLKVVSFAPDEIRKKGRTYTCKCSCGHIGYYQSNSLKSGNSQSCGCAKFGNGKHNGLSQQYRSEYNTYLSMIDRCHNHNSPNYHYYGGRGIKVCKRWKYGKGKLTGFECFLKDMGPKPFNRYSLDRINNFKGYKVSNCRWATTEIQAHNKMQHADILAIDPGTVNFAACWISKGKVVKTFKLVDPLKFVKSPDFANDLQKFRQQLATLIEITKPQALIIERFIPRRFSTNLAEMINLMIGYIIHHCEARDIPVHPVTTMQWKNALKPFCNLDQLYKDGKKQYKLQPHPIDAMCMGKYLMGDFTYNRSVSIWIKNNLPKCASPMELTQDNCNILPPQSK